MDSNFTLLRDKRHFSISLTTVSHPSAYAFLVRLTCGTRPLHLTIACPEVDRSTALAKLTPTDTYTIPTGCLTHKKRTNRILTRKKRSSTEHLYPVASVRSFEHVQNLSTDKTDRICCMRNGQETHANGHERTDLLSVTRPLALSGKV